MSDIDEVPEWVECDCDPAEPCGYCSPPCSVCGAPSTTSDGMIGAFLCDKRACFNLAWDRAHGLLNDGATTCERCHGDGCPS